MTTATIILCALVFSIALVYDPRFTIKVAGVFISLMLLITVFLAIAKVYG